MEKPINQQKLSAFAFIDTNLYVQELANLYIPSIIITNKLIK